MMWPDNDTSFLDFLTSVAPNDEGESESRIDYTKNVSCADNESLSLVSYDEYCKTLKEIGSTYNKIHGFASITVCIFGTLANILNFLILTRKEMANSTNTILTGLAVSDLLNLVEYVPYAIYTDFLPDAVEGGKRKTYPWAVYVLIHSNFSQVCHTISIWLTVTVAVWRYFMVSMPFRSRTFCSVQRARLMTTLAYCITPILCVPIYFAFSVQTVHVNRTTLITEKPPHVQSVGSFASTTPLPPISTTTSFKYVVNLSNLSIRHPNLVKINFWIYSVVLKIIPCVLLTVVSFCLINSLVKAKKRKEMLLGPLSSVRAGSPKPSKTPGFLSTLPVNTTKPFSSPTFPPSPAIFTTGESSDGSHNESSPALGEVSAPSDIPLKELPLVSKQKELTLSTLKISHSLTVTAPSEIESEQTSICDGISRYPSASRTLSSTSTGDLHLTSRTTRMLLTVLILFLITEFPQGILALFSAIIGQEFFKKCYIPMANMMDFLALVNCSINFILYSFMSKRFRDTFKRMLRKK